MFHFHVRNAFVPFLLGVSVNVLNIKVFYHNGYWYMYCIYIYTYIYIYIYTYIEYMIWLLAISLHDAECSSFQTCRLFEINPNCASFATRLVIKPGSHPIWAIQYRLLIASSLLAQSHRFFLKTHQFCWQLQIFEGYLIEGDIVNHPHVWRNFRF